MNETRFPHMVKCPECGRAVRAETAALMGCGLLAAPHQGARDKQVDCRAACQDRLSSDWQQCRPMAGTCPRLGEYLTMETWDRPSRSMESRTDRIRTELGNLYLAVTVDENGRPFEVFGWIGKTGTFGHGMTELACRLLSLHLRRGTPIEEIIEQCRGIRDMTPTPNVQNDGTVVWNTGVGDAIAQVLRQYSEENPEDL